MAENEAACYPNTHVSNKVVKGDVENPINNTLSKASSAIFSVYKRATGVCLLPWLYNNQIKPSQ